MSNAIKKMNRQQKRSNNRRLELEKAQRLRFFLINTAIVLLITGIGVWIGYLCYTANFNWYKKVFAEEVDSQEVSEINWYEINSDHIENYIGKKVRFKAYMSGSMATTQDGEKIMYCTSGMLRTLDAIVNAGERAIALSSNEGNLEYNDKAYMFEGELVETENNTLELKNFTQTECSYTDEDKTSVAINELASGSYYITIEDCLNYIAVEQNGDEQLKEKILTANAEYSENSEKSLNEYWKTYGNQLLNTLSALKKMVEQDNQYQMDEDYIGNAINLVDRVYNTADKYISDSANEAENYDILRTEYIKLVKKGDLFITEE